MDRAMHSDSDMKHQIDVLQIELAGLAGALHLTSDALAYRRDCDASRGIRQLAYLAEQILERLESRADDRPRPCDGTCQVIVRGIA